MTSRRRACPARHDPDPLSVLLFELVLAPAYARDVFAEIVIANGWAHVVRGDRDLDADAFDASGIDSETARALIARNAQQLLGVGYSK
jgi:hypothetical protein